MKQLEYKLFEFALPFFFGDIFLQNWWSVIGNDPCKEASRCPRVYREAASFDLRMPGIWSSGLSKL